jgi:hypothetical protein
VIEKMRVATILMAAQSSGVAMCGTKTMKSGSSWHRRKFEPSLTQWKGAFGANPAAPVLVVGLI